MLGNIRLVTRCAAMVVVTFGLYGFRVALQLFTFAFPPVDRRVRVFLYTCWARTAARILGMRVRVEGHPPRPPFFLVTNHVTYLDGILLSSLTGCLFVLRGDVASWPVLGFLTRQMDFIFIDRAKRSDTVRVNELIAKALANGESVVMFAESTTSIGAEVCPFKTALFEPAAQGGFPVHCAAIHYDPAPGAPPAKEWITWWTGISFGAHVSRVLRQRGLTATVTFGREPVSGSDRKALAEQTRAAVQALFQPMA